MKFTFTLKITHPRIEEPITRSDSWNASSLAAALKYLNLPSKLICDLKNSGTTEWVDAHGGTHLLTLKTEAI